MRRHSVNKARSARAFKNSVNRTNVLNVRPTPQRGGYRM